MMSPMGSMPPAWGGVVRSRTSGSARSSVRRATFSTALVAILVALASVGASTSDTRVNERIVAVYDFAVVDRADRLDHIVALGSFSTPPGTGGIAVPDVLVQTTAQIAGIYPGPPPATTTPPALTISS